MRKRIILVAIERSADLEKILSQYVGEPADSVNARMGVYPYVLLKLREAGITSDDLYGDPKSISGRHAYFYKDE